MQFPSLTILLKPKVVAKGRDDVQSELRFRKDVRIRLRRFAVPVHRSSTHVVLTQCEIVVQRAPKNDLPSHGSSNAHTARLRTIKTASVCGAKKPRNQISPFCVPGTNVCSRLSYAANPRAQSPSARYTSPGRQGVSPGIVFSNAWRSSERGIGGRVAAAVRYRPGCPALPSYFTTFVTPFACFATARASRLSR